MKIKIFATEEYQGYLPEVAGPLKTSMDFIKGTGIRSLKGNALPALILLPFFVLLHSYNELFGFIHLEQVIIYAAIIYIILAACYFTIPENKVTASKKSLILFILTFFILFYLPIHKFYGQITFHGILSGYWVSLPLWCLFFALLIKKIIKMTMPSKLFMFLNIVMLCLLSVELGML